MLITLSQILFRKVQIRLFCDRNTGMTEDFAQRVNVHPVHKTPLCEIVAEAMRGNIHIKPAPPQIALEISLKSGDLYMIPRAFYGEQIIALYIAVFIVQPPSERNFCLCGEIYNAVLSAFRNLRSQKDLPLRHAYICQQQTRALTQPHTTVHH